MKIRLITFLFLFITSAAFSQNTLTGKLLDAKNGEQLVGATIKLYNPVTNAITQLDGSFKFKDLSSGNYHIQCAYLGYLKLDTVLNIGSSLSVVFYLQRSSTNLHEVTIVGVKDGSSQQYARRAEQKSDNVSNIVSAKSIQLSPDLTVANVLQRVSGVSIERSNTGDGENAIIRGMDKRYNVTLINGVKIPSPDNRNRFVPLDIFPADLLDRLEVIKSLTPNMEADASGGVMNIVMKDAPDHLIVNANAAAGYSQIFLNQDAMLFGKGAINLQSPAEINGEQYLAKISDFTKSNYRYSAKNFPVNSVGGFSIGNRFLHDKLGAIAAFSYQNNFRGSSSVFFEPSTQPNPSTDKNTDSSPVFTDGFFRTYTSQQNRVGAHLKLDYHLSPKTTFSLFSTFLQLNKTEYRHSIDSVLAIQRVGPGQGLVEIADRSRYEKQNISSFTLQGKHLVSQRFSADWSAVYSKATRKLPDFGQLKSTHQVGIDANGNTYETPFLLLSFGRDWQHNTDKDLAGYLNLHYYPTLFKQKVAFDFGGLYRHKNRDNYDNKYTLSPKSNPDGSPQVFNGIDQAQFIFNPANAALGSASSNPGVYTFDEIIAAGYGELKFLILKKLEFLGGVRFESTAQNYETSAPISFVGKSGSISYLDVLPSAHFKYILNRKQAVRLSYYKSISRPAYADIIPFPDASTSEFYTLNGNINLKHTQIDNLDFRYEVFPGGLDAFMVGAFYKFLQNPIEYALKQTTTSGQELRPDNFGNATNYGVEVVFTKYFGTWGVSGNYTYTHSNISSNKGLYYRDTNGNLTTIYVEQNRPLQGQSAHIGNFSLLYKNVKQGIDAQLAAVYTGERIAQLSLYRNLDYWQKASTVLDFSAEKKISKHLKIYAKANNLLNTPYEVIIKQPNRFTTGKLALPAQNNNSYILTQRDLYQPSYLLGLRYKL
ncbi:TonB-dependent receptor [Pedobacter sp. SD-b]|uniref:TonB-dependent receptor n=1 Tax=Pedobacter segetis TaxID=2793069 RepID=A0ABS1BG79_9SPHI|nr:TonB-dependent receptor [Pedobacter segetis]MBK0381801.1 TonB-dependent receptor [Pedobacter segetis]